MFPGNYHWFIAAWNIFIFLFEGITPRRSHIENCKICQRLIPTAKNCKYCNTILYTAKFSHQRHSFTPNLCVGQKTGFDSLCFINTKLCYICIENCFLLCLEEVENGLIQILYSFHVLITKANNPQPRAANLMPNPSHVAKIWWLQGIC